MKSVHLALAVFAFASAAAFATDYRVGPGQPHSELDTVPWEGLNAGDTVIILGRSAPYATKFVLCRQGTQAAPITVRGIDHATYGPPVITGQNATTPSALNFWGEGRGVIKIGGANNPPDTMPAHIVLENLVVESGRPAYSYTGDDGATHAFDQNGAAVYVEKGEHIVLRNVEMRDCGNGLFAAWQTTDLLVEGCYLHDNGIDSHIYEHNNYTEAKGIVFQFNRFGPLRAGCPGNNLKDRSAGCVIRYNWIEGGNRQLDLVDSGHLHGEAAYGETFVYGNVLVEPDGAGNSQIVHYGGDSGTTSQYRKGTLYFHHNTVVSTRTGNTTLFRLSTADETCRCANNIVYVTDAGNRLALMNTEGTLRLSSCWFKTGYVTSHSTFAGTVQDLGGMVTGASPGFVDETGPDFEPAPGSGCLDAADALDGSATGHPATQEYVKHRASREKPYGGTADIGAFEMEIPRPPKDDRREGGSCGATGMEVLLILIWRRRRRR